jgi:SAM-dependent methyltransferase
MSTTPFKDHFSGHAARYAEARPRYPAALFEWLARQCAGHALCWDAGCGNGQASVALAAHFAHVHATDPSAEQVAHAHAHERVAYRVEPAERCSLGDGAAQLATIAQAMHWVELDAYYAEVRRVLAPGGVFATWCYGLMRIAPEFDALVAELYEPVLGPYWAPERHLVDTGYATLPFPFEPIAVPPFEMRLDWTLAEVLGYLETWSAVQKYRRQTGCDPLAPFAPRLAAAWGEADRRPVEWPLSLRAGRVAGRRA